MKRGARSNTPGDGRGAAEPDEDKGAGLNSPSASLLLGLVALIFLLSSACIWALSAILQPSHVCV
jgi:hypothetical protein